MAKNDTVTLPDGTTIPLCRPNSVSDADWAACKDYLQKNPSAAKAMQTSVVGVTENPMQMEQFREVMALAEVMKNNKDTPTMFQNLANDPQLATAFNEMKAGGMQAVMKYYNDPQFLHAVSVKMGGLPEEVKSAMRSLPEACKAGDSEAVKKLLDAGIDANTKDDKGISALHYAVGVDRLDILKLLMDKKADPKVVDKQGNTLLHYAAGYGRQQTTEYFLQCGLPINNRNARGETPLDVANRNKHQHIVTLLRSRGAM
jgi:hypothetical protein